MINHLEYEILERNILGQHLFFKESADHLPVKSFTGLRRVILERMNNYTEYSQISKGDRNISNEIAACISELSEPLNQKKRILYLMECRLYDALRKTTERYLMSLDALEAKLAKEIWDLLDVAPDPLMVLDSEEYVKGLHPECNLAKNLTTIKNSFEKSIEKVRGFEVKSI
jgi:hypothetical protein